MFVNKCVKYVNKLCKRCTWMLCKCARKENVKVQVKMCLVVLLLQLLLIYGVWQTPLPMSDLHLSHLSHLSS